MAAAGGGGCGCLAAADDGMRYLMAGGVGGLWCGTCCRGRRCRAELGLVARRVGAVVPVVFTLPAAGHV